MAAFDFAKVKDPTFFKENVLNAHASFRTYASREEYRTGSSSLALKLDGIWKFAYAKNYTSATGLNRCGISPGCTSSRPSHGY